jgi:twitching motility protein PilJ
MERSIQHVVDGTDLADEAYGKLEEIEKVSDQLAELVESISASAKRQSAESENITKLMQEVGLLTGETTAATRETTTSMEKITSTSKRLEESIAVFKVEEEPASV